MVSIETTKAILNKGTKQFNDDEIKQIREYLYQIGRLELENNTKKNL